MKPDHIQNNSSNLAFDEFNEEQSSFDLIGWVMKFVRYWYLFVISIAIALVIIYLQNRTWQPSYQTTAKVMIEEGGRSPYGYGNNLMQGFGVQAGYRNVNNQRIMFGSHDLISKVVDKLPLSVDYYARGRFKENNLYKISPIDIQHDFVSPMAYSIEFTFIDKKENQYEIQWENENKELVSIQGTYNTELNHPLFHINIRKTLHFIPEGQFYFRFKNSSSLVNEYASRLSFNFVMEGSSVIGVSLDGKVVQRDIDFINTLCETFIDENLEKKNEVANKTISFIDLQLSGISDSIEIAERKLKSYRIENQIVDVNSFSGQLMMDSRRLQNDFSNFKLKEAYITYLSDYIKLNMQEDLIASPSSLGFSDPSLLKLVTNINELQFKKQEVGPLNPFYERYEMEIRSMKDMLNETIKSLKATLDIEKNDLIQKSNEVDARIMQLPNQESQMSNYTREFKIHDDYYTFLLQKRAESQIQKASNSPDNVLLEKARVMSVTNGGEKKKNYMTWLFIGLLLPVAFVLLKEFLNNKIVDKNDMERLSSYQYLGSIKHQSNKNVISVLENPRSSFAESFRIIRTRIEFLVQRQWPINVLITSAESGDGKTSLSVHVASMYVLTGRKTILVDLDLRKPSIADKLSLSKQTNIGISNYLIEQVDTFEELIIKDERYGFDVLLGGTIPPNPGELIRTDKLKNMLEKLSTMYDHVIIDSSPVGLVADAYALMHMVDVNLFIARSEKTNKSFFKSVMQQLRADNLKNIYLVLNDVAQNKAGYYSEYGRNSYYMKKNEYQSYTKEYFDDDDSIEKKRKGFFRRKKNNSKV